MKKNVVTIALALFFLLPVLRGQGAPLTPTIPDADKIKITGGVSSFDSHTSLSINVHLSRLGAPLLGAKIRMNSVELRDNGGGDYAGNISPYKPNLGDEFVFTLETLTRPPAGVAPRREMVVLASYRVDNLLTWIFPTDRQVIDLSAYPLGEIPLRWKFSRAPVPIQLRISDKVARTEIILRTINSESYSISSALLHPGKSYLLWAQTVHSSPSPLGRFKLGKLAAPGSEVRFNHGIHIEFSTAPAK